ncbi:hypothetical protein BXZ70DRAFT_906881 [Cristinia sonorae]|uniref:Uncharacterized protein n=1 Tax=Cristinia sonorae TaxID=1940300 RepID=A0A8K0XR05_9AGAR|nr:hypothetical protein BXZ70DRAFT_906881 [Cristinia sonorae]
MKQLTGKELCDDALATLSASVGVLSVNGNFNRSWTARRGWFEGQYVTGEEFVHWNGKWGFNVERLRSWGDRRRRSGMDGQRMCGSNPVQPVKYPHPSIGSWEVYPLSAYLTIPEFWRDVDVTFIASVWSHSVDCLLPPWPIHAEGGGAFCVSLQYVEFLRGAPDKPLKKRRYSNSSDPSDANPEAEFESLSMIAEDLSGDQLKSEGRNGREDVAAPCENPGLLPRRVQLHLHIQNYNPRAPPSAPPSPTTPHLAPYPYSRHSLTFTSPPTPGPYPRWSYPPTRPPKPLLTNNSSTDLHAIVWRERSQLWPTRREDFI